MYKRGDFKGIIGKGKTEEDELEGGFLPFLMALPGIVGVVKNLVGKGVGEDSCVDKPYDGGLVLQEKQKLKLKGMGKAGVRKYKPRKVFSTEANNGFLDGEIGPLDIPPIRKGEYKGNNT
jgi:hypothetical protein